MKQWKGGNPQKILLSRRHLQLRRVQQRACVLESYFKLFRLGLSFTSLVGQKRQPAAAKLQMINDGACLKLMFQRKCFNTYIKVIYLYPTNNAGCKCYPFLNESWDSWERNIYQDNFQPHTEISGAARCTDSISCILQSTALPSCSAVIQEAYSRPPWGPESKTATVVPPE